MSSLLSLGAQIVRPDPDGQYRLQACPNCGSSEVVYTKRIKLRGGVEWVAGCLVCEKATRAWPIQHHAQIEWNGRDRPSWERD